MANSSLWYILHNPYSGEGRHAATWQRMQAELERDGYRFVWISPTAGEQVSLAVAQAIERGARQLLVLGGDGSHHLAINGLMMQQACLPQSVRYALFPAGTGNDWARMYRLPRQPAVWLQMFRAQRYRCQDVGVIEARGRKGQPIRHYFANVLGMGYDAEVVRYLAEQHLTDRGGWRYARAIYRCLNQYRAVPLRVEADQQVHQASFYSLNVGICRYSGNGMRFVPQADPQDGQLAYTLIDDLPAWRVAINTPWLYTPYFDRHPLSTAGQATRIRIAHQGGQPSLIEADGELIGQTPATLSLLPLALQFLAPAPQ